MTGERQDQRWLVRLATPIRILIGIAAAAGGVALILAPLTVQTIAAVTGLALIVTGIARLLDTLQGPVEGSGVWVTLERVMAAAIIVFGAVVALRPPLGAAWLAFIVAAALIAHGLVSVIHAVTRKTPYRVAEGISAAAAIVFGALAFSWPVLTLTIFRFGVGAWFVFFGLRLIFEAFANRRNSPRIDSPAASRVQRWVRTIAASTALLVALAFTVGSASLLGGAPLPEPDAFYVAPADVPSEPGTLIRSEPLTTGVPTGAEAWKILFTTTHPDGSAAISSGTVIAPADRDGSTLPLLTVSHGTTGVVAKCAPSLSATPFADGAGAALETMVTQHGWVAVTADYIGLGTAGVHPYLVGDAEARNVLDASRAVQQLNDVNTSTDTVVWGHSQGGQGALWTSQIAAEYAPEFSIKGTAAFAPAADLYGLADADKKEVGGKTVSAYIASTWDQLYPELELAKHLTPGSKGGVERIHDLCFNGKDVLSAILFGTQIPNQVFPDSLLNGAFGDKLKAQTPVGPFPAPVMVAQGLADPLVKPKLQHDWVESRCTSGEAIDYRTFPGLDHNSLVAADSPLTPQLVQWTLDRWEGASPTPNCDDLPG